MTRTKNPWLFGAATFIGGWLVKAVILHLPFPGPASPQILLLAVLALGSMGCTNLAQTLGFFWGLGLDVFGLSLFGEQAWVMAAAGYASSRFSRQLNVEKLMAQETVAFSGTVFFALGLMVLEALFRGPGDPHVPSPVVFLFQLGSNLLLAPLVFWTVRRWLGFQWGAKEKPLFHD